MKALTISQPWAKRIADGNKFVENRTWSTPYRGPLAIHAGLGTQYLTKKQLEAYDTGVIIATCELVTCIDLKALMEQHDQYRNDTLTINALPDQQRLELQRAGISLDAVLSHHYTEGPICWVLTEIRKCQPAQMTGKQGLWEVPVDFLKDAINHLAY